MQHNTANPFDEFFIAQHARPNQWGATEIEAIPAFLRSLLVKDGTVTSALAAFFLQSITTEQLAQTHETLEQSDEWLGLEKGTDILRREVVLRGSMDQALYLFACSELVVERLPSALKLGLAQPNSNLGKLLRDSGFETRREGLWWGLVSSSTLPHAVHSQCDGDFVGRTYRITLDDQPLMTVTEYFPLVTYKHSY